MPKNGREVFMSGDKQNVVTREKAPCGTKKNVAEHAAEGPLTPKVVAGLREELERAKSENARLWAERALAEERQKECAERFQTVLEQSVDIAYRRNVKTDCYDYLSPAIATITGYTVEEFSRISSADLLGYIHPEDHPAVMRRFEKFEQSRYGSKVGGLFEYRLRCKDGTYRWMSDSGVLVIGNDGTPLYHVGVARDVTERKQMEEALRRSNEELEDAVDERTVRLRRLAAELALAEQRERRRLSDFLHDDLQQLLVAAKFACEKLVANQSEGSLEEGVRRLCDLLLESLVKTRSISKELVTPLLYVVGVVPALRQMAELMWQRYKIRVQVDAADMPDLLPEAVRLELFHSVRELLLNVAKHAGTDKASVKVWQSDGQLEISVTDEGKGFDPGPVLSGNGVETGYGLYSISERINALGGKMSVGSIPGQGTSITLSVPALPDQEPEPHVPLLDVRQAALRPEPDGRSRVLVADDHQVMRRSLVMLLANEPDWVVVGEASDGQEAVDLVRQLRPDVVVTDIRMPGMDGIEATRLIKAEFPETIVIGISAYCEKGFEKAMLDAGAAELLDKAGLGVNLGTTLTRCLAERAATRERRPS